MEADGRIPRLSFASAGPPRAERFEALREVSAPFYHVAPTEAGLRDPDAAIDSIVRHDRTFVDGGGVFARVASRGETQRDYLVRPEGFQRSVRPSLGAGDRSRAEMEHVRA